MTSLHCITYSGQSFQLSPESTWFLGISHAPWRSHKPEYLLEDVLASPELMTRAYVLANDSTSLGRVWGQSKVKAAWFTEYFKGDE